MKQSAEAAGEIARQAPDDVRDVANRATRTAKEMYQSAAWQTEDALATTKDYVRRHPVPMVLGVLTFGVVLGYALATARQKPTFGERYAAEPLAALREAVLSALAPVSQGAHKGYGSALDGAGKAIDRINRLSSKKASGSLPRQMGRIGNTLKFW